MSMEKDAKSTSNKVSIMNGPVDIVFHEGNIYNINKLLNKFF